MMILNAGVPRSGTVLVNAIVQALLRVHKVTTQVSNPVANELPTLIRNLQRRGDDRHRATLIHVHEWDRKATAMLAGSPWMTGFINYRDPRDVCVSLMRLHEHPFAEAAENTVTYFVHFEQMVADLDLMVIPYEHLAADTGSMIFQIARRLGFFPGLDIVAEIRAQTSIEQHRKVMQEVQEGTRKNLLRRQNRERVMVEDKQTLINDRHIQSGVAGRWRSELTAEEQDEANRLFAPLLKRYGYEPT